ncbi:MAG: agmatinase [Clostridiales bacterium]|nr:agmatinase [Clostridiales bacterium]
MQKDEYAKSSGIWCGLNRPDLTEKEADIVVFGIPYDEAASYRKGAAEAPSVLRANTFTSAPSTEEGKSIEELIVYDAGDFAEKDRERLHSEVSEYVCGLVKDGVFFTCVGGDHSVTIPIEAGVDRALGGQFGIIHIDAHSDLCDTLGGDRYSHGCVQRRALELENIAGPENIYFVGIRSFEPDEIAFLKENWVNMKTAKQVFAEGVQSVAEEVVAEMQQFSHVYVTVDIDGLDPAYAAGTGTPQPGGLSSRELLYLLEEIFQNLNVVGFDVVEVAPSLDPSLSSMFAARKIITECWGHYLDKIKKTHLNLLVPQWQGGGQDLSTLAGAMRIKEKHLYGANLAEIEVSTSNLSKTRNGIRGYSELFEQLIRTKIQIIESRPATIFAIGGGCDADIMPVSYLNEITGGDMTLLYFDAHGDLNTPESSESKCLYGMPLRTLLGEGDEVILDSLFSNLSPSQVVMVGVRDLDMAEAGYIKERNIKVLETGEVEGDIERVVEAVREKGHKNVYLHIDLDVLDPDEFACVPVKAPGGLKTETLLVLLKRLREEFSFVGLGLFEYSPSGEEGDAVIQEIVKLGCGL